MHTFSNRAVFPPEHEYYEEGQHPTLDDIAIGLSRTFRFSGQTPRAYSVLAHTMVVGKLVAEADERFTVYALLHDAHEALIGDTPRPWKHDQTAEDEAYLDAMMRRALGLPAEPPPGAVELVREADEAALWAEAHALGHRRAQEVWPREQFSEMAERALQMTFDNITSNVTEDLFKSPAMARQVFIQNMQASMPGQQAAQKLQVPNGRVAPGKVAKR